MPSFFRLIAEPGSCAFPNGMRRGILCLFCMVSGAKVGTMVERTGMLHKTGMKENGDAEQDGDEAGWG